MYLLMAKLFPALQFHVYNADDALVNLYRSIGDSTVSGYKSDPSEFKAQQKAKTAYIYEPGDQDGNIIKKQST